MMMLLLLVLLLLLLICCWCGCHLISHFIAQLFLLMAENGTSSSKKSEAVVQDEVSSNSVGGVSTLGSSHSSPLASQGTSPSSGKGKSRKKKEKSEGKVIYDRSQVSCACVEDICKASGCVYVSFLFLI